MFEQHVIGRIAGSLNRIATVHGAYLPCRVEFDGRGCEIGRTHNGFLEEMLPS